MLRYTILDIIINNNDNISQQTLECFIEAIVEDPKIDIIKEIIQEIGEVGDIQHRIILRYDNEFIPVIKNINSMTPIIPLTEIPQNWHQYRCIGFDLAHDDDIQNNVNTDYNFCVSETFHLKEQIENLIKI